MIPTDVPIHWLSRVSRSAAIKSVFCSRVVTYRPAFIAVTRDFPRNGMCFSQESCHSGGTPALAVNLGEELFVGTLKSEDSGAMSLGHIMDQSTAFGGRAFRSFMF